MTPIQAAVLLLRFFGVYLFFEAFVVLTELPTHIYGIYKTQFDFISAQRKLDLGLALARLFVYAGAAIACLFFSRPLAKLFTKGLESVKHDDLA
jgi:hypothetical protein